MNLNFFHIMKTVSVGKNIVTNRQCSIVTKVVQNHSTSLSQHSESHKNKELEVSSEDLSHITSFFPQSFNLAAYVNTSETLKNLLHLNVRLEKIEKNPYIAERLLKLNFEQDVKEIISFLDNFVATNEMGNYITKNPMILCGDIEDYKIRINYLESKCFDNFQIKEIISRNPFWLMFSTIRIDKRLGFFQNKFDLSGNEVRALANKQPKIITYNLNKINTNLFVIKEEMGFSDEEIKKLILMQPKLWMISQKSLLERFNYFHNIIKIPHNIILKYPNSLLCRSFKVKQRHQFLMKLGRAQFDPHKENYIPIMALAKDTDIEFCNKYAKCNINDFNMFLKTL